MSNKVEKDPRDNLPTIIPEHLRPLLRKDRHGISFPTTNGCQLRIIRNRKNLGKFFSYRQYGGVENAILAAIEECDKIRGANPVAHVRPRKPGTPASVPVNGVGFRKKYDKRRAEYEHFYWASYKREDRPAVKTFSLGYTEYSDEMKQHAFESARYFRKLWDAQGPTMDFDQFKSWKRVRLYEEGHPACDFTRPRRKRGESVEQHSARMCDKAEA